MKSRGGTVRLYRRTPIAVDSRRLLEERKSGQVICQGTEEKGYRYSHGSKQRPFEIDIDLRELNLDVCRRASGYRRFDREIAIANSYPLAILSIQGISFFSRMISNKIKEPVVCAL